MIYLDHASTTPLDSGVLNLMKPYLTDVFGNPASQHSAGRIAAQALLSARDYVASSIGCTADEVYFTAGGTEAGNWALKGAAQASVRGRHIVLSAIEHPALLESAKDLQKQGFEITYVFPDESGRVSPSDFEKAIRCDTVFCGLMHANNETGVIQPVEEVGKICRDKGVFFYIDCVQTAGVLPLPAAHCDALGISAHKFYGPKGVGAIYINKNATITRFISGGKQERGLRGGTSNVAGAVGLAEALKTADAARGVNNKKTAEVRDAFLERVLCKGVYLNGDKCRLPANANIYFEGCDGESVLFLLDMAGICASMGSACSAGAVTPSHVLTAMGYSDGRAKSSVRFTFGKNNTLEEANIVADRLKEIVAKIRK